MLSTDETISIKAAMDITTRIRMKFLPHRATISTEIGERFLACIAFPSVKKPKALSVATGLGLLLWSQRQGVS